MNDEVLLAKSFPSPPQRELNALRIAIEKGNSEVSALLYTLHVSSVAPLHISHPYSNIPSFLLHFHHHSITQLIVSQVLKLSLESSQTVAAKYLKFGNLRMPNLAIISSLLVAAKRF